MMISLPTPLDDVEYRVVDHILVTASIVDLRLEPVSASLPLWRPGQYVLLGDIDYEVPVRSYSIANAADAADLDAADLDAAAGGSGTVRLLVTLVPGGALTEWVHHVLEPGAIVLLSGPYGVFGASLSGVGVADLGERSDPVLCLAGGSGIAPMIALAEDAVGRGVPSPFAVVFSVRTTADVIDDQRWRGWSEQYRFFRFDRTLTREPGDPPLGRIPGMLAAAHPDLSRHEVCIAGDPGFVRDCARAAREQGARPGHVHTEEFFAEPQPWVAADVEAGP